VMSGDMSFSYSALHPLLWIAPTGSQPQRHDLGSEWKEATR
jgi:hypothetical protein